MFTIKIMMTAHPGNMVQHTYSCSTYLHESRANQPPNDSYGPALTLYDASGAVMLFCPLEDGVHAYIENERGKTIDHFIGTMWLSSKCYDSQNGWVDPRSLTQTGPVGSGGV